MFSISFDRLSADSHLLQCALRQYENLRDIERQNPQDCDQSKELATVVSTSRNVFNNNTPAFLTRPFAIFLMKELQQWNGACDCAIACSQKHQ